MFKPIKSLEGKYSVDECGRVINNETGQFLTPVVWANGYLVVTVYFHGKRLKLPIHRLVAETFIPNPNNFPVVMHLDNDKRNPYVYNLKWDTQLENMRQAYRDGRRPYKVYHLYHPSSPVYIECLGRQELIDRIGFDLKTVRKYIERGHIIESGPYQGWQVVRTNVKRSPSGGREPLALNVEPQA